jgi:hypothetical protein
MIFADRAISGGPAAMARSIFISVASLVLLPSAREAGFDSARLLSIVAMMPTRAIIAMSAVPFAVNELIVPPLSFLRRL